MKLVRTIFVPEGTHGSCASCGDEKHGPSELFEFQDLKGAKISVCFQCRPFCTQDRLVDSFTQRRECSAT